MSAASTESSGPASPASSAVLPPGPAHRSSHRPLGASAAASAAVTSCEPSSCTPARPSRTAGSSAGFPDQRAANGRVAAGSAPAVEQLVDLGQSRPDDQADRGARVVGPQRGLDLLGRQQIGVRVDDPPRDARCAAASRSTIEPGGEPGQPARRGHAPRPGAAPRSPARSPARPTVAAARSTVAATAACTGTRMARSWWVPSRSRSSTAGCRVAERPARGRGDDQVVACPGPGRCRPAARWRTRRRGR